MHVVQDVSGELKTQMDLGAEVYCQARVPDTSRVFIGIGLGFLLECTLEEVRATWRYGCGGEAGTSGRDAEPPPSDSVMASVLGGLPPALCHVPCC